MVERVEATVNITDDSVCHHNHKDFSMKVYFLIYFSAYDVYSIFV